MNAGRAGDVDRLFSVPLDRFVSERNALVKELKREGDAEAAAEVAALRKPSLVAWTVNQLAHERRRDVDLLLDAGRRLVDAQQASIAQGGRGDLDAAQRALRRAVETLVDAARGILGERASGGTMTRVAETLRSAATSPLGRELLARGRLVDELSETGWDVVASLSPGPAGSKSSSSRKAGSSPRKKDDSGTRTRESAELRRLEQARAAAEKRVHAAARRAQVAADRLAEAQGAHAAAEEELAAVEREIAKLRKRS